VPVTRPRRRERIVVSEMLNRSIYPINSLLESGKSKRKIVGEKPELKGEQTKMKKPTFKGR